MHVESKNDMLGNIELFDALVTNGTPERAKELLVLFDIAEGGPEANEQTDIVAFEKSAGEWKIAPAVFASCSHKELKTFVKQRPNATAKEIKDFVDFLLVEQSKNLVS